MSTGGFDSDTPAERRRRRLAAAAKVPPTRPPATVKRASKRVAKRVNTAPQSEAVKAKPGAARAAQKRKASAPTRRGGPRPTAEGVLVEVTEPDMVLTGWDGPHVEEVPAEMDELQGYKVGVAPDTIHLRTGWDGSKGGRQLPWDTGTSISVTRIVDRGDESGTRKPPRVVSGSGALLGHIIEFTFLSCDSVFTIEKARGKQLRLLVDGELVYTWSKVQG